MYASKQQFVAEVTNAYSSIKAKNSWANKYFELEMQGIGPKTEKDISARRCWKLYLASRGNALGVLLLGEVSMRSKHALVQNFGLTSAFGHEDDEPWLSPWLGTALKDPIAAQPRLAGIDPRTLDETKNIHLQPLQGGGSILSDRLWTPLMNDAWLLGGVHARQSFHLVTEGIGEQKLVAAMEKLQHKEKFERSRANFGGLHAPYTATVPAQIKEVWRQWFIDNPHCLYETWGPRVLVRELIGLMSFGYQPNFSRHELAFECVDETKAGNATIEAYSNHLELLHFHDGITHLTKESVLKAFSQWMFGRSDALDALI